MGKRGPKEIQVDWAKVNQMLLIQCTAEEIASVLGMSVDTLSRRCESDHKLKFAEYSAIKRQGGKASLRRMQWKHAENTPAMAIFLGKNILDQSDKRDLNLSGSLKVLKLDDDEQNL